MVSLVAGTVAGGFTVLAAVSFAALIFGGDLSPYLPVAFRITLVTAVIVPLFVAWYSSYPGTIAIPQDRIAPILALLTASVLAAVGTDATPEAKVYTVVAAIVLSTLVTGIFLYVLGRFRLGGFIRFIPYPVIGGFLAGSGWLLVIGALRVMTGAAVEGPLFEMVSSVDVMQSWLPGAGFGLALVLVLRRWRHFLILPCGLVIYLAIWYGALNGLGYSLEDAQSKGWLLGPFQTFEQDPFVAYRALAEAEWFAIFSAPATLGTIMLVSAVSLLLNSAALELEAQHDIHLNQELRAAGIANVLGAGAGGMVGFHSFAVSTLALRMGARGRWLGCGVAAVCALALVVGLEPLGYLPRAVLGGLLFFLGLSLLLDWLWDGRGKLGRSDYLMVWVILAAVGLLGYLQGIVVGLIGAIILFVLNYSRVDVVKHELTGEQQRSNVDRPPRHMKLLESNGAQTYILGLQGFVFFGTANRLFNRIRHRVEAGGEKPIRYILVDFRRVTGMDSSATMSFVKLGQLARRHRIKLGICSVSKELLERFKASGARIGSGTSTYVFDDIDRGLEWCEDVQLIRHGVRSLTGGDVSVESQLADIFPIQGNYLKFLPFMERIECMAGITLIEQGSPADDIYFIESGRVSIYLEREGGTPIRVRKMAAGTVTGELGIYLGGRRTASVVTDTPTVVYKLSRTRLEEMTDQAPELAATFHRSMAELIATRLAHSNNTLRAVFD